MDRIAAHTEIVNTNPQDSFARYGLAMALAAADRNDDALAQYDTLLGNTPDYVPAYQMSSQLLLKLGRSDQARTRIEAGIAAAERTGNTHAAAEMAAMLDELR